MNSPASGDGPIIAAGRHTLVRVWDGQEVRQYVDGRRTNRRDGDRQLDHPSLGLQFTSSQSLDEAYVPLFGAFSTAWDDAMVILILHPADLSHALALLLLAYLLASEDLQLPERRWAKWWSPS